MIWILSNTVECAMAFYMRPFLFVQFCTSHYAKIMCADIDKTVGYLKRYLTKRKLVTLKLFCSRSYRFDFHVERAS